MNVAAYIANFLVKKGVKHIFGFQGGAILKIIDEVMATGKIEYIQNYHEQASAFCADAYSRINGNLGVAIATSGPGATNLVTGIANAYLDSIPTLFITGQDYSTNLSIRNNSRQNGFQDLDIISIVSSITKYAKCVTDPDTIPYELEKAYDIAISGRPGTVLLDIPIDIQFKDINFSAVKNYTILPKIVDYTKIDDVLNAIVLSKRPVILAGGGIHISKSFDVFSEFASKTGIPVVNTLNGLDAYEGSFSFAGLHGNTFSNLAVQNADLLIVLGARLGQRQVGKEPAKYTNAKIIHIDIDTSELNRITNEFISIQSDIRIFLEKLNDKINYSQLPDFYGWRQQIEVWEEKYKTNAHMNKDGIDPIAVVEKICSLLNEKAIITADVGQNQMWVAQAFRVRGRQRLLNSSGLGSMGYSLPASIGAHYAEPDLNVISFTGDGGLQMNLQELLLIGQKQLNIKCVVMNNNTLGMMREVQKRYYNSHYYGADKKDFVCADLKKLASTYDLGYYCVETNSDIDEIKTIIDTDKPYLIDVKIQYDSLLSNRYDESHIFEVERLDG